MCILGDMLELGPDAGRLHHELVGPIEQAEIDLVFACGPYMRVLYDALPTGQRGAHTPDSEALAPIVADALRGGDIVLVKGSLGSRMTKVVDAIKATAIHNPAGQPPAWAANGA